MENEKNDTVQSKNRPSNELSRSLTMPDGELYHKGQRCYFDVDLLCQEGWCSECHLFKMKVDNI
jgi:hypothetical protein